MKHKEMIKLLFDFNRPQLMDFVRKLIIHARENSTKDYEKMWLDHFSAHYEDCLNADDNYLFFKEILIYRIVYAYPFMDFLLEKITEEIENGK